MLDEMSRVKNMFMTTTTDESSVKTDKKDQQFEIIDPFDGMSDSDDDRCFTKSIAAKDVDLRLLNNCDEEDKVNAARTDNVDEPQENMEFEIVDILDQVVEAHSIIDAVGDERDITIEAEKLSETVADSEHFNKASQSKLETEDREMQTATQVSNNQVVFSYSNAQETD